jgi:hypothetical protein
LADAVARKIRTRGMNRLGLLFASDPRFGAKVDGPPLPQ